MDAKKLENVLSRIEEPERRALLKKLIVGAAFSVPLITSFSVGELHASGLGSGLTTTTTSSIITTLTVKKTVITTATATVTTTLTTS